MKKIGVVALEAWGMVAFAQMWLADSLREQLES
ncbi:hypothetical protein E143388_07822 [Rhodococcus opacus]|nr:hypothetical protein E143388_07822 [Rhodococcus opacus]